MIINHARQWRAMDSIVWRAKLWKAMESHGELWKALESEGQPASTRQPPADLPEQEMAFPLVRNRSALTVCAEVAAGPRYEQR